MLLSARRIYPAGISNRRISRSRDESAVHAKSLFAVGRSPLNPAQSLCRDHISGQDLAAAANGANSTRENGVEDGLKGQNFSGRGSAAAVALRHSHCANHITNSTWACSALGCVACMAPASWQPHFPSPQWRSAAAGRCCRRCAAWFVVVCGLCVRLA